tara:strand:+ start:327 stop:656 length:330 start_codon:yes stop_codon:yes gene_type:complete
MKITKSLKYATFEWDDEQKSFTITEEDGNRVSLNKVYSFAFMRFVVRMAQRNWFRKIKDTTTNKPKENSVELADHPWEDPDQMVMEVGYDQAEGYEDGDSSKTINKLTL